MYLELTRSQTLGTIKSVYRLFKKRDLQLDTTAGIVSRDGG